MYQSSLNNDEPAYKEHLKRQSDVMIARKAWSQFKEQAEIVYGLRSVCLTQDTLRQVDDCHKKIQERMTDSQIIAWWLRAKKID